MPKSLSERVLARAKQKEAKKRANNHAAFLAQRDQIKQSLADGWAILHIWETLHLEGKITTGYAAFCRRVKRSTLASGTVTPNATGTTKGAWLNTPVYDGFKFDSIPNKEDLL